MCLVVVVHRSCYRPIPDSLRKYETIEAQAFGTGTQMGQNIGVTLNIYRVLNARRQGHFWSRPSRRARTRDWSTPCRR